VISIDDPLQNLDFDGHAIQPSWLIAECIENREDRCGPLQRRFSEDRNVAKIDSAVHIDRVAQKYKLTLLYPIRR